jgi:RNA polymerase sigma-70 factor (ECF subfamily)
VLDLDERVRALRASERFDDATTLILKELGAQLFRYIFSRVRDAGLASDAFSHFSEDLWKGIAGFSGRSSVKVWAFAIARNAAGQELRGKRRHQARAGNWSSTLSSRVADVIRTETVAWNRTDAKNQFAALREQLAPEEQELLLLRTTEKMSWDDIAKIHLDETATAEDQKREAARLRKRFQLARDKLRKLASEQGLVPKKDESGE